MSSESIDEVFVNKGPEDYFDLSVEDMIIPEFDDALESVAAVVKSTYSDTKIVTLRSTVTDGSAKRSVVEKKVTIAGGGTQVVSFTHDMKLEEPVIFASVVILDGNNTVDDANSADNEMNFTISRTWRLSEWMYRNRAILKESQGASHDSFYVKMFIQLPEFSGPDSIRIIVPTYSRGFFYKPHIRGCLSTTRPIAASSYSMQGS